MNKTSGRNRGKKKKKHHAQVTWFIPRMYPTISCPVSAELKEYTGFRTQKVVLDPRDSQMNGARTVLSAGSDLAILSSLRPASLLEKGWGLIFPVCKGKPNFGRMTLYNVQSYWIVKKTEPQQIRYEFKWNTYFCPSVLTFQHGF